MLAKQVGQALSLPKPLLQAASWGPQEWDRRTDSVAAADLSQVNDRA
jgi:hypothetical protein